MLSSNGPTGTLNGGAKSNKKNSVQKDNRVDSAAGLKAILGVNGGSNSEGNGSDIAKEGMSNATVGLKTMLGIASSLPKVAPEPEKPQPQRSAADALMQMMVQAPTNLQHSPVPVQQTGFNFTYVKEGESATSFAMAQSNPNIMYPYNTNY